MNRMFYTQVAVGYAIWAGWMSSADAQSLPRVGLQLSGTTARVTLTGSPGTSWTIQFRTGLDATSPWLPLANLTLGSSTAVIPDISGPVSSQHFYRAIAQPAAPTNITNPNLVWVPAGTFLMGSPGSEIGRQVDEVQHPTTITRGFLISRYLVSQAGFFSVMSYNPSYFQGTNWGTDLTRPVEQVHWYAASAYCAQLTLAEHQAGRLPTNWVYRLPTEAEWEYACRAGTTNRFSYGDDPGYLDLANYSWYSADSGAISHGVGQKLANPGGLFDVHGDVYEWCQDWYGSYPAGLAVDPQGPDFASARVFRGGSWAYAAQFCRSAGRYSLDPTVPLNYVGFRVVAAPNP